MRAYWSQESVFSIRPGPEVDGTLPNIVKEGARLATARKDFDLPELDSDPFCLNTLLAGPDFDGLFEGRVIQRIG